MTNLIRTEPGNISSPDAAVAEIDQARTHLHDEARRRLGVTGEEKALPLLRTLREHKVTLYPVMALGVLTVVDQFQGTVFATFTPDMARSLGVGFGAMAGMMTLQAFAAALAPMGWAALTQSRPRRALLILVGAIGWSLVTIGNGLVVSLAGLALVLTLDGLLSASGSLHAPLIMDTYPPTVRMRMLSAHRAFQSCSHIIGPLLVFVCTTILDMTWRGTFVVLGSLATVGVLLAAGLRDPGFGKWDTERIRDAVHDAHHEQRDQLVAPRVQLGFFEIVRRLLIIPTIRRLAFGYMVFGILLIPFGTMMAFYLDERWGLDAGQRALFGAFNASVGIVALLLFGRKGEKLFRKDPARVVDMAGIVLVGAVVAILIGAMMPIFALVVALFAVAQVLLAVLGPMLGIAQLSVVESSSRPHMGALMGIFLASGSMAGLFLLSGVQERFGIVGALASLMVPGVAGALIIRSAKKLINRDLDRMINDIVEDEEIKRITSAGGHLPLLACRRINFSYGQLQVLFGVDFTVDEGEMVALLGTNGSGKSTLLKVISGIGLPTSGTVRYGGRDITYLDAERRVKLGINQIPGGRAVFPRMNVLDNLRLYGYTLGRNRKAVDAAIDRSLETFPRLHERRHSLAGTLSGGEQQMLGLSKALILRPKILLIDELSLGLAPVIVGQLLELVREINKQGTAVVLVEQSVNIALSVADHAYFMEKGQIRFDGPSHELLDRSDLLRAVFLEGVTNGARR